MYEAALARAVPVIDTPPGDMVHDFLDGHNCIIVDPSVDAIVDRLDQLLRDPQTIDRVAEQAFQLAQRKHTLAACSASLFLEIDRATSERSTFMRGQGRQGRYARVAVR